MLVLTAGCASRAPRWEQGATLLTDEERPPKRADEVAVYYKREFSTFDPIEERQQRACRSTTLLRQSWTIPDVPATEPPDGGTVVAQLATDEFPRDDDRSRLKGNEFTQVFGIGKDEFDLFVVVPDPASVERGVRRLREMAAKLGADEVRDVFYTGYAEHQMWEGTAFSLSPTSTRSIFYVNARLLEFRLRDVRFHGTAIRRAP
jgi:hypothetical protein